MILAQHSRRSTSLAHALAPLLHFPGRDENLVTETPFSRPLFSSTSALFHFPYPVTLLFATLTKTAGCIPTIPNLELATPQSLTLTGAEGPSITRHAIQVLSFHILAHSFARTKTSTLFFSNTSTLFAQKHPGV